MDTKIFRKTQLTLMLKSSRMIMTLLMITSTLHAQECGTVRSEKTGRVLEIGNCNGRGERHGEWTFYFDNNLENDNRLKAKGTYSWGKKSGTWTYYDGTYVLKEATYAFGRLNGPYKEYYAGYKNRLKSKGKYQNDKREGQWTEYWTRSCYDLFPLKEVAIYKAGIKHGESATYFDACLNRANIASKGFYVNGKKDGRWNYYDGQGNENANLIKGLNFKNGLLAGKHYLFENDRIIKSYEYTAEPGDEGLPEFNEEDKLIKKVYPDYYLTFYENDSNTPIIKEKIPINEKGEKIGTWLTYYESGGVQYEDTPEGRVAYHENGRLFYTVSHSKNDRTLWDGIQKVYRKNGSLEQLKLYIETLSWGKHIQILEYTIHFYPNGKIHLVNRHTQIKSEIVAHHELYEDGSFKVIGGYNGKSKYKEKEFKMGKKFPTDPPEWAAKAYRMTASSTYREKYRNFFELADKVAKGK